MNATQRGGGANMSVDINLDATTSMAGALFGTAANIPYYGYMDAVVNQVIATADPTNPRIDVIAAYIDLSAITSAVTNNVGALKFKDVTGTPAGSPAAPNSSAIQTAVGAGNPYIVLANVAVAAAASSIVNANITDTRSPMAFQVPYLWGGASNTKGHLVPNQADGTLVTTTDTNSVSAPMLSTGAISLASPSITSNFSTTNTSATQVTGLTATVTIPSGGRKISVRFSGILSNNTSGQSTVATIWDGTVGSGTQIGQMNFLAAANNAAASGPIEVIVSPGAGSKTYNVGLYATSGQATIVAGAGSPATLIVEVH